MNYEIRWDGEADKYLKEHPDATLAEYVKWKHEEENRRVNEKLDHDNKRKAWYNALIGRYFYINFNNKSRCIFEVAKSDKHANGLKAALMYRFYKDGRHVDLEVEIDQSLNETWFNNPYANYISNGNVCVKEIDEDTYYAMTNKIDEIGSIYDYLIDEYVNDIEKN